MYKVKILIVDDIPANIISLEYLLNDSFENIDILSASNGEEALKIAFETDIDLIILDIQMPIMDGFETAKYLKKSSKTKEIPIIFLTAAFVKEEFAKKGFESGAVDYLTKPIDNNQFVNKLKLYIEIFRKTKELEEKQKEQNRLLSFFDKGDTVLIKWTNLDKKTPLFVSKSFEKLFECSIDEFYNINDKFEDYIYKEDLIQVKNEIKYNLENKNDYFRHTYFRILTKNKNIKWISSIVSIQRDKNGEIEYCIEYITDITEEKNNEKIIFEQSKLASMGEMIGNIAHQWRQPLSVISTSATGMLLQKECDLLTDEKFEKACNSINDNAQYLSKTIDDFKNFIKNEHIKEEFNLLENIDKFLNIVDGTIHTHNIKVIKDIDKNIKINGYPNELNQCLINIFNNAKDALESNNIDEKIIFITAKQNENNITISIKDNALGIPNDIIGKIFEPYFTTKHQSQGTGLGLSMTHNLIVNGMQGDIEVVNETYTYDNKTYKGANFIITL